MNQKIVCFMTVMLLSVSFSGAIFIDNQLDEEIEIKTLPVKVRGGSVKKQSVKACAVIIHTYDDKSIEVYDQFSITALLSVSAKKHGICQFKDRPKPAMIFPEDVFSKIFVKESPDGGCEVWFDL